MVGDGETGEPGAEYEASGPDSEAGPPSSRGRRALLAARVAAEFAEHSNALHERGSQTMSGVRLALERELHRFPAGSRPERASRQAQKNRGGKGASRGGKAASAPDAASWEQLGAAAGRPGAMSNAAAWGTSRGGDTVNQQGDGALSDEAALADEARPGGNAAATSNAGLTGYTWLSDVAAHDVAGGDVALGKRTMFAGDPPGSEFEVEGQAPSEAGGALQSSGKRRRRSARSSGSSMATRLLLPVLAASWTQRVAALRAREVVPPKRYRPTNFAEAFALTAEARRALPKEQIRHLNTKASKIVERALAAVAFLDEWREAIAQGPFDVHLIDLIDTLARSLSHADALLTTAYEAVASPGVWEPGEATVFTPQQRLIRLLQLARATRRALVSEVKRLIDRGQVPHGVLSGLKGRAGHLHAATDIMALVNILQGAIAAGTHVTFTTPELERCTTIAYALIEGTSQTPPGRSGAARAAALEERSRAFTLLWLAHREAHWALACIFRDELDVKAVLPPLVG